MFGLETVYPRPKWTWRTLLAMPLLLLLIPLIVLAVPLLFLLSKITAPPEGVADLTADDLVTELRAGFESLGSDDKWEGFIETRLADVELDSIRGRAA
jgi:hypothetical protein